MIPFDTHCQLARRYHWQTINTLKGGNWVTFHPRERWSFSVKMSTAEQYASEVYYVDLKSVGLFYWKSTLIPLLHWKLNTASSLDALKNHNLDNAGFKMVVFKQADHAIKICASCHVCLYIFCSYFFLDKVIVAKIKIPWSAIVPLPYRYRFTNVNLVKSFGLLLHCLVFARYNFNIDT